MSTMHFVEEIKPVVQAFICYTNDTLSCVIYSGFCIEEGHGDKHNFTRLIWPNTESKGI